MIELNEIRKKDNTNNSIRNIEDGEWNVQLTNHKKGVFFVERTWNHRQWKNNIIFTFHSTLTFATDKSKRKRERINNDGSISITTTMKGR